MFIYRRNSKYDNLIEYEIDHIIPRTLIKDDLMKKSCFKTCKSKKVPNLSCW